MSYEINVNDIVNLEERFTTPDVAKTMKDIDINFIVSGLAHNVKSLRTIALTVATREHGVWLVDRDSENSVLQRLEPAEATKVVREEERQ